MFTSGAEAAAATRVRPALVVSVLACAGVCASVMQTMLVPLVTDLPGLLDTTADNASWLVTATLLAGAVAMPIVTRLADMHGKRRMILFCLLVMLAGSLLGVFGASLGILVLARAMQGFALAVVPVSMSVLRDELPRERLAVSVAIVSATIGLGGALAFPLTGIVYATWGWHAIFWMGVVLAATMLVVVRATVPESPIRTGGRFDLTGGILLSIALTSLLLGITQGNRWGWTSAATMSAFGFSLVIFAMWFPWELRSRVPLVDLRTSARRAVLLANVAALLGGVGMFSNILTTIQQLELPVSTGYGFGLSTVAAGVAMVPTGVVFVFLIPLATTITRKYGPAVTLTLGNIGLGLSFLARIWLTGSAFQVVLGACLVSAAMALAFAALPVLIMQSVPLHETAAANGLNTLARSCGLAVGSAVVAAVVAGMRQVTQGVDVPSESAFVTVFILAALACFAAAAVSLAIPRQRTMAAGSAPVEPRSPEPADL